MSFSFDVRGKTKVEARAAAAAKLEEVVGQQPCHRRDQATVQTVIDGQLKLLTDDDEKDVVLAVNGSISDHHQEGASETIVTACSVSVSAYVATRQK